MHDLPGLGELWLRTRGNPAIRIAVLDGPVELAHPGLVGAMLKQRTVTGSPARFGGSAGRHGTRVAELIFGRTGGIAPHCTGISLPIFSSDGARLRPCSQLDPALALTAAIQEEVHVINVSGGEFTPSGEAHPLLADVVRECERRGILIVAAAGNEGCDCLHVPAAMSPVLAVGAIDAAGEPLEFSNWGAAYRRQGIVAPGADGTSFAAARGTGVAALLLSLQIKLGQRPDPPPGRPALRE